MGFRVPYVGLVINQKIILCYVMHFESQGWHVIG